MMIFKNQIILSSIFFLLTLNVVSQQNFVNVPNSEITPKNKHFFQQQVTSTNSTTQLSSSYNYGLGKGIEFGLNIWLINIKYKPISIIANNSNLHEPITPTCMLNAAKQFSLTTDNSITIGGQFGNSLIKPSIKNNLGLTYLNFKFKNLIIEHSILVFGTYYSTKTYGGDGNRFGAWIGVDVPISKQLYFMGESIFGSNYISTSCIGLVYAPVQHIPLTFALQLPNNKNTITSFVFEITILPKN